MSSITASTSTAVSPRARLEAIFEELAELTGQRNAIDGRIVDLVAEIDHNGLWGATGCRSIPALVAWRTGASPNNAATIAAIAHRQAEFPQCVAGMREGRFSLDQVGVIAQRAADGSDAHYAQMVPYATVTQLRTAVSLEPRPDPEPRHNPLPSITKTSDAHGSCWRIKLDHLDAAKFDAALHAHLDALMAQWKHDHDDDGDDGGDRSPEQRPPLPTTADAFLRLVETSWDAEVSRRPHGQHTTVIAHLDVEHRAAALHLGPLLTDAERQYLTCDATCEVWFHRAGTPIGAGRTTRTISRRLRRALELRDRTCAVPGCGATRGLHAHHIQHWDDGGPTELNKVISC